MEKKIEKIVFCTLEAKEFGPLSYAYISVDICHYTYLPYHFWGRGEGGFDIIFVVYFLAHFLIFFNNILLYGGFFAHPCLSLAFRMYNLNLNHLTKWPPSYKRDDQNVYFNLYK